MLLMRLHRVVWSGVASLPYIMFDTPWTRRSPMSAISRMNARCLIFWLENSYGRPNLPALAASSASASSSSGTAPIIFSPMAMYLASVWADVSFGRTLLAAIAPCPRAQIHSPLSLFLHLAVKFSRQTAPRGRLDRPRGRDCAPAAASPATSCAAAAPRRTQPRAGAARAPGLSQAGLPRLVPGHSRVQAPPGRHADAYGSLMQHGRSKHTVYYLRTQLAVHGGACALGYL